ncbi:hypothetical protein LCGC14_0549190 [marine sediment metagenome]|uniref:Uncharacterized protein n=1 Tax=marine sediment metagenome TaxID=412755 RepID=A0A0F9UBV2_9ZZZZ
MSDDAFLEVLAGCTDVCAGMDLSDDGWAPPDGEYDVMLEDVTVGVKEKDGINNAWVKPTFHIPDGEFAGRTFSDFYWIPGGMTEPPISVKNLCRLATCLQGSETKDPIEAAEVCKAGVSEYLTVQIYRTTARKGKNAGKVYVNIRFLALLAATDAPSDGAQDVDASVVE